MNFYNSLQMSPEVLKAKIRKTESKKERRTLWLAMFLRSVLLVAFSVILIAPISSLFGAENSCVGVVLLCILLAVRFVNFGYCMRDSLVNLALSFIVLWVAPVMAAAVHPVFSFLIHFAALLILYVMTSQEPEMGNGGLYSFSYILLSGNPVGGALFWKRGCLFLVGFALCGLIYVWKHHGKNREVTFVQLIRKFRLSDRTCSWQLQVALGVSLLLALGSLFSVKRVMWAGFACASLLGCYSSTSDTSAQTRERFGQRILGAVLGSVLFAILYTLLPDQYHGLLGPLGGICLGFCTDYRYKTTINCLGALMMATSLYGLHESVLLRIINNLLGAAFGYGFFVLYQKFIQRKFTTAKS